MSETLSLSGPSVEQGNDAALASGARPEAGQVGPETKQSNERYKKGTRFLGRLAVGVEKLAEGLDRLAEKNENRGPLREAIKGRLMKVPNVLGGMLNALREGVNLTRAEILNSRADAKERKAARIMEKAAELKEQARERVGGDGRGPTIDRGDINERLADATINTPTEEDNGISDSVEKVVRPAEETDSAEKDDSLAGDEPLKSNVKITIKDISDERLLNYAKNLSKKINSQKENKAKEKKASEEDIKKLNKSMDKVLDEMNRRKVEKSSLEEAKDSGSEAGADDTSGEKSLKTATNEELIKSANLWRKELERYRAEKFSDEFIKLAEVNIAKIQGELDSRNAEKSSSEEAKDSGAGAGAADTTGSKRIDTDGELGGVPTERLSEIVEQLEDEQKAVAANLRAALLEQSERTDANI